MPISDNAATFLGINNENEFYSAHYLAEVFKSDINDTLGQWLMRTEADAANESLTKEQKFQPPYQRLKALARDYFVMRERSQKERNKAKATNMQRESFKQQLAALDIPWQPHNRSVGTNNGTDLELPVLSVVPNGQTEHSPKLWVLGALDPDKEGLDPLLLTLHKEQFIGEGPQADSLKNESWYDLINDVVFKQDEPPRWVLLLSDRQLILIDRYKWLQNRLLRFDWDEILGRKDDITLKATAVLLHQNSLVPEQGSSLLDSLDENSHKHAFGVSEDLKYALREAIELLGNEAAQQLIQRKEIGFTGKSALDADALSRECLRYMYRMLFLFYIEARPELKYVPHESQAWRKGYSLEGLRDLELVKLTTDESRKGFYLHHSINKLFTLIHEGYDGIGLSQGTLDQEWAERGIHNSFSLEKLDSHLFDPKRTPYLNKVKFSNQTLQTVIRLMSLTRETKGRGRKRRGRVSYAQLGINQLGSVYEALLSYRGFFATTDLYEVKKAGETPNELETGYFVTASEIDDYKDEEKVFDKDENGHRTLRVHEKSKFIYRLAGRDRQKSASYYTPEVLTKCLVKYTLKERLEGLSADDILNLTVCEPAMGSAAFLNEAVNQLSEAYLTRKQQELNKRIPHEEYREALQQVKMHLADHNVYGVDLNSIAVELAEVSLWLNALSQSNQVPWFGYQLFNGNSLIGARRQVYRPDQLLTNKKETKWYNNEPKRLDPMNPVRDPNHVYHFLLPDDGMAGVNDKEAKKLKPEVFAHIKQWKAQFLKPLTQDELQLLQQISGAIDALWQEHTQMLRADRNRTEDRFTIWGHNDSEQYHTSTEEKDQIRAKGIFNNNAKTASAYRRLKLVMDYWCALWFWPLDQVALLPDRSSWLFELNLILQGQVFSFQPEQGGLDFTATGLTTKTLGPSGFAKPIEDLFAAEESQLSLTEQEQKAQQVRTAQGELHLEKLFEQFPRLKLVNQLAGRYKFFHWELTFADIFADKGGFDVMLGNPPWLPIEWNEGGLLGEYNPHFVLGDFGATQLREQREPAFERSPQLKKAWFSELEQVEGTQNFLGSIQSYSALIGQKVNLYKNFILLSCELTAKNGNIGLIHQEGLLDAKRGEVAREYIYSRLIYRFQYFNELKLFSDVHHRRPFSLNVYRSIPSEIKFTNISNLFSVNALYQCFNDTGSLEGIKGEDGKWSTKGSPLRQVVVDKDALCLFRVMFDSESKTDVGTRLPNIHAGPLVNIIRKISEYGFKLERLNETFIGYQLFDENLYQSKKCLSKNVGDSESGIVVYSGPNIYIGNPFYKTPRMAYKNSSDYEVVDLNGLPERGVKRTLFRADNICELMSSVPSVPWGKSVKFTDCYRVAFSEWVDEGSERTLAPCLIYKGVAHINTIVSLAFKDLLHTVSFLGMASSLPVDFIVKSTGVSHVKEWLINKLPFSDIDSTVFWSLAIRSMSLNCLSNDYSSFWECCWNEEYNNDRWTVSDERLDPVFFSGLIKEWNMSSALRTDFSRRQALLETDVLSSMILGLSLDELIVIYRAQFHVMRKYERDTWYDANGRIVFTNNSQGLSGVGLSRKVSKKDNPVVIEYPDGRTETQPLGWEDAIHLPDGTKIHRTVMDDTLPGGPREKIITYISPWYLPNREDEYRVAWEVFTERFKDS